MNQAIKKINVHKIKRFFLRFIYILITKLYQYISTAFENIFLKKSSRNLEMKNIGFFKYKIKKPQISGIINSQVISINKYLSVKKLDPIQIKKLINEIFNEKFRTYITKTTGFKYSIDFLIFYDRYHIPKKERCQETLKQFYSYIYHFDKPNSSNVLKIILPINIDKEESALRVYDIKSSKNINNKNNHMLNHIDFKGSLDNLYGFLPALCWHKDGIPKENEIASQIMFQLNPWPEWSINDNLSQRNPNLNKKLKIWTNEPKFRWITLNKDKRNLL